ncbi:MAG: hypothetical protein M3348_10745, partial [Acidobacteriota bacterium]|nr:hypothetical protein [Acidobacteriota bacterium]
MNRRATSSRPALALSLPPAVPLSPVVLLSLALVCASFAPGSLAQRAPRGRAARGTTSEAVQRGVPDGPRLEIARMLREIDAR